MSVLTKQIPHQVIEQNGKPVFAVIPFEQFEKMVEQYIPDESDVTIPHAVVRANVKGDSMIKAWREHLGLTQGELAERAGVSQPAIVKLEKPGANLRHMTVGKLAVAMNLSVEQLEE